MRRRSFSTALPAWLGASAWPAPAWAQAGRGKDAPRTLHLAISSPETVLDPVQTNSDSNTASLLAQILEAPLCYDYLARPVALALATAAEMPQVSADARVFTVRLQPGIFFADDPAFKGQARELVAQDYVYAIKRYYDPRYNSSDLYLFESLKLPGLSELRQRAVRDKQPFDYDTEVEGARALDRYRLRITLGVPDPRFIYMLASPQNLGAVAREVVEHYGAEIGAHPVGTGAFRLKRWRRASRIEFERSPSFRAVQYSGQPADEALPQQIARQLKGRSLPLADHVIVDVVEESQPRWLEFLNGRYHWMPVPADLRALAAPGGALAPYLARRGMRLQRQLLPDMRMFFFNMIHPLVGGYTPDKVALRRAIGLAFDGEAYRQQVASGLGLRGQSLIAPFTSGFDPAYRSEMSEHSPARAKALLDLFAYVDRDGDGWRETPEGRPLVLSLASGASQLDRRSNEIWQRSMKAVGLRIEFDISTWPELLKKTRTGTLMMFGYIWSAGSPDGGFFLGIAYGPNGGESNDARFDLPAYNRLFEQQRALPDGPEREAVMLKAKNLLAAYLPYKALLHNEVIDLLQPWTQGYWRHPFMRDTWRFVDPGDKPT